MRRDRRRAAWRRHRHPLSSIRWRFVLWMSLSLVVAVGIAFAYIYHQTGQRLQDQARHDLTSAVDQLTSSLQLRGDNSMSGLQTAARRYVHAQPFSATSRLLFVLTPTGAPISNHPELLTSAAPEAGETPAEQDREDRMAARLRVPSLGYSTRAVADVGQVRLLERRLNVGTSSVVIGAGDPLATVTEAQQGVVRSFIVAGAVIGIALLLAAYFISSRVTAPLRRMAHVAELVDAGDLEPRMDAADLDDEISVLARAFNHMLERLDGAFASQRAFVADASHELRTPLTVIQGQIEVLSSQAAPDRTEVRRVASLVNAEIERMRRMVDDLLLLAKAEQVDFLRPESVDLERFLTQVWDGASLIADRRFELGSIPPGALWVDPDRLAQAVRNLIDNAIAHTRERSGVIRLDCRQLSPSTILIVVSDDGPGIPPEEVSQIFERFHRTSQTRGLNGDGAGLGLAIVRAIVEAHDGHARAANRREGSGAVFELELPGFVPSQT